MNVFEPKPAELKPPASPLRWRRHLPLAATLGSLLVIDGLIATAFDVVNDITMGAILGIVFAQVVLLAVWTALGPAKLPTRIIMGFCGTMLVGLALVAYIARFAPDGTVWIFFSIVSVQWLVMQIPFQICRLFFGWRLSWPDEPFVVESQRGDVQFGIGQLMVWTALIGITLAIGRSMFPEDLGNLGASREQSMRIFGVLTVYNSLFAWPIAWAMLAPRWWASWLVPAGVCCLGLTFAEILTFQAVMGRGGGGEVVVFWVLNSLQAGAACVPLLAMRVSGFRLIRSFIKAEPGSGG